MTAPIILARDKVPDQFCALVERFGPVAKLWEQDDPLRFAHEQGQQIRAMFCIGGQPMLPGLIEALPNLKFICSLSIGYEGLPMDLINARGIVVANSAGSNSDDVADIAVTHLLAQQAGLLKDHDAIVSGRWEREGFAGVRRIRRSLMETKVGIVGLGAIGLAIAKRLAPHGCDIAWWGPRDKPDAGFRYEPVLRNLADWCHFLVVAGRADSGNRHMIDKEIIEAVGPEGVIVNVSRGMIIDEEALIAALKSGKLGGAGLDVFEEEPSPGARWKDVPNLTATPHTGGAGSYAGRRYREIAVENFDCFFNAKPITRRVN